MFDLDGTVLDGQSLIGRECAARMRAAMMPGLACTVASGRDMERIAPFIEQLGWMSVPVIAEQGAVVAVPGSGDILTEKCISRDVILGALEAVRFAPVPVNVILYGRGEPQVFRNDGAPSFVDGWASGWYAEQLRDIPAPEDVVTATVRKITLKCLPGDTSGVREMLTRRLGNRATVVRADVDFVNVTDAGVHKGSALEWLIGYLGIDATHVMAVGDCEADQTMFAVAGVSVAVANADEGTRSRARFTVPSNVEQGAAVALERFAAGEYTM